MGDFRIVVEALGGHGCQREKGDGETVIGCERPGCPDCMAREFVRRLKRSGATVKKAEIQHWPADLPGYTEAGQVHDDLLTGVRTGTFPEREQYVAQSGGSRLKEATVEGQSGVAVLREIRSPGSVDPDAYEAVGLATWIGSDQTQQASTGPSSIRLNP